jgi:hypothetical protein
MMLNPSDLEPILFDLFKDLCRKKVFARNKGKGFFLSIDAYCAHSYHEMSAHSPCPYCLKRERDDKVWYLHINVVASLVFPDGLQLPLYVHRLKAQNKWAPLTDRKFKEECELTALPLILAKVRHYLPKMKFTVLLVRHEAHIHWLMRVQLEKDHSIHSISSLGSKKVTTCSKRRQRDCRPCN